LREADPATGGLLFELMTGGDDDVIDGDADRDFRPSFARTARPGGRSPGKTGRDKAGKRPGKGSRPKAKGGKRKR